MVPGPTSIDCAAAVPGLRWITFAGAAVDGAFAAVAGADVACSASIFYAMQVGQPPPHEQGALRIEGTESAMRGMPAASGRRGAPEEAARVKEDPAQLIGRPRDPEPGENESMTMSFLRAAATAVLIRQASRAMRKCSRSRRQNAIDATRVAVVISASTRTLS